MIKPAEKYSEDKRSILHIIHRPQTVLPGKDYIDDLVHNGNGHSEPSPRRFPESNAIGECNRRRRVATYVHKRVPVQKTCLASSLLSIDPKHTQEVRELFVDKGQVVSKYLSKVQTVLQV